MNIVRFNPWSDERFFRPGRALAAEGARVTADVRTPPADVWVPPADVWETAGDYRIDLDIPAVAADEVEVQLNEGVLTVPGERLRVGPEADDAPATDFRRHRTERRYGKFARSFRLPEQADEDSISANARDGVLHLVIGKRAQNLPRRIEIAAA